MSTIVKVVVGMVLGYGFWALKDSESSMEDWVVNLLKSNRFKKIRQALQQGQ